MTMETARQPSASISPSNDVLATPAPAIVPTRARRGRRPFVILAVIAAVAVGAFVTFRALTGGRESTDDGQVAAARAAAARAGADLHKADIDLGRARALHKAEALPQERLDAALIAVDAARAAKAQAEAQVALAEDSRRGAQSRVGEARGRVNQSAPVGPQIDAARAGTALANARAKSAEAALALARLQ